MSKKIPIHFLLAFISAVFVIATLAIFIFMRRNAARNSDKAVCKDCNVIVLTLDSCSAVHMPCYGYNRETTPNLCKFASENQLFLNSYANAPWTLPSHTTLMTGLLPSHHGVNEEWRDKLAQSIPLLPEIFQNHGYETVLYQEKNSGVMPIDLVYNRGVSEVDGEYTIKRLFDRLDRNGQKNVKSFFTYYIPVCHEPNRVGAANKLFTKDNYPEIPIEPTDDGKNFTPKFYEYLKNKLPYLLEHDGFSNNTIFVKRLFDQMLASNSFEKAKSLFMDPKALPDPSIIDNMFWAYIYETYIDVKDKKLMNYLRALYDQELLELDSGELLDFLNSYKNSKEKDKTILLITAEHGQEFGEHGVFGHTTLYEGNIRVPFILSVPGMKPHVVSDAVQGVDVMPTLLDLVGINGEYISDGVSVAPLLFEQKIRPRIIVAEDYSQYLKTLRNENWKLFVRIQGTTLVPYELYNIKEDPMEKNDVLTSNFTIANMILEAYNKQYGIKN